MPLVLPAFLKPRQPSPTPAASPAKPLRAHRRLTLRVERDGLLVFAPSSTAAARIPWGRAEAVARVEGWSAEPQDGEVECSAEGLLGLLRAFEHAYLFAVDRSTYEAQLPTAERGTIRALAEVLVVPLERTRATAIVAQRAAAASVKAVASSDDDDGSSTASDADEAPLRSYLNQPTPSPPGKAAIRRDSDSRNRTFGFPALFFRPSPSRQQDISALAHAPVDDLERRPEAQSSYLSGVAAGSAHDTLAEVARQAAIPSSSSLPLAAVAADGAHDEAPPAPELVEIAVHDAASREHLDAKIVRECARELRHGMYLSYDASITRHLQWKAERRRATHAGAELLAEPDADKPLVERADVRFLWNRYLARPFLKAGLADYVVPLMQGFVRQETISLPADGKEAGDDLTLTVISRRSVERPGLRYMRRGINGDGQTANMVETEMCLELERPGADRQVASYVQTRGSIPLFWSQSPWALKPVPVLERSAADNAAGIAKHFDAQTRHYGRNVVVNLAEQHGKEGLVVDAYRATAEALDRPDVAYTAWDFHRECKGMRFENVSRLVALRQDDMDRLGMFCATPTQTSSTQSGVFRTNCIDCLDRTNVVQSAFARRQLAAFLDRFQASKFLADGRLDAVFNDVWASNGDAISRQYAGSSALKGDYVRSGKRDWRGVVNDASNSMARYFHNGIGDFFKQAMLDYVLGVNLGAFEEFAERVTSSDPGKLIHLATIRTSAIETAAKFVLADGEKLDAGWTLLSPAELGRRPGPAFEERVLLLSDKALYACSFEYTLQKVRDFVRVPLGDLVSIAYGPYILSTLSPFARDPKENAGFVVAYQSRATEQRAAAYSLRNRPSISSLAGSPFEDDAAAGEAGDPLPSPPSEREMAFKVLRRDLVADGEHHDTVRSMGPTAEQSALAIVRALHKAAKGAGAAAWAGDDGFLRQEAVVSFAEAERNTGLLARLKHNLEHAIWL